MADYVRRLVSGPKARFRDHDLNLELDLVYITPRVIIMGYPAEGFESFYRNRRADAKRFLDSRHGKNYWVFNLCPLRENGYEKEVFEGRVTRFPFPDHHAPPLALMPLVAREMHVWLDGSSERVVVIHCKAGKGRSGTMACTYLLTLATEGPSSNAAAQTEDALNRLPDDLDSATHAHSSQRFSPIDRKSTADPIETKPLYDESSGLPIATSPEPMSPQTSRSATLNVNPERSFTDALKGVLDLHTAKRMKPLSPAPSQTSDLVDEKEKKQKQGVSIPSQRRYLHYWALVLNGEAPKDVLNKGPSNRLVRITQIRVRMREPGGVKLGFVRAANVVLNKTIEYKNKKKNPSHLSDSAHSTPDPTSESEAVSRGSFRSGANRLWASIARYDDELIDFLEGWERKTRDQEKAWPGHEARFRGRSEEEALETHEHGDLATMDGELRALFDKEGTWDKEKMVRSFARFGLVQAPRGGASVVIRDFERRESTESVEDTDKEVHEYVLGLVSDKRAHRRAAVEPEAAAPTAEVVPTISVEGETEEVSAADSEGDAKKTRVKDSGTTLHAGDSSDEDEHDRFEASSVASSAFSSAPGHTAAPSTKTQKGLDTAKGLVVEASREVRVKLYVGQVFIGWMWFIPSFHMPPPPSSTSSTLSKTKATFHLTRKDLDFPLGLGTAILDVNIDMEWVQAPSARVASSTTPTAPLGRVTSSMAGMSIDASGGGIGAGIVQAVNALQGRPRERGGGADGESGVRKAVEVGQSKGV